MPHPEQDLLIKYILNARQSHSADIEAHLKVCLECQEKVRLINNLLHNLKDTCVVESVDQSHGHLVDDELVGFVYGGLPADLMERLSMHVSQCGACKKSVLKLKTCIAENKLKKHSAEPIVVVASKPSRRGLFGLLVRLFRPARILLTATIAVVVATIVVVVEPVPEMVARLFNSESDNEVSHHSIIPGTNSTDVSLDADTSVLQTILLEQPSLERGVQKWKSTVSNVNTVVNWYSGYLIATAVGSADMIKIKNQKQAELVAEDSARRLAQEQLSQIVNSLVIARNILYQDLVNTEGNVISESKGLIQNGNLIGKKIEWYNGTPKVTLTINIPIFGAGGLQALVAKYLKSEVFPLSENIVTWQHIQTQQTVPYPPYTGIVIDAREALYKPSLQPILVDQNRRWIFPVVDNKEVVYATRYIQSMDDEAALALLGGMPLVIAAKPVGEESGMMALSSRDTQLFQTVLKTLSASEFVTIAILW